MCVCGGGEGEDECVRGGKWDACVLVRGSKCTVQECNTVYVTDMMASQLPTISLTTKSLTASLVACLVL